MNLNRLQPFVFITVFLILLSVSTANISAFDKKATPLDVFAQEYVDLSDRVVRIRTFGVGYGVILNTTATPAQYEVREGAFGMEGSGFVKDLPFHKFIITNDHVISPSRVIIPFSKNVSIDTKIIYVKSKQILVIGCYSAIEGRVLYTSSQNDIAVLFIEKNSSFQDMDIPLMFSRWYQLYGTYIIESPNILSVGDAVGVIVQKRNEDGSKSRWYEMRIGKIVSTGVKLPGVIDNSVLTWFQPEDFTMDIKIYPGDSGSPVVVWLNGKPLIIGVVRAIGICYVTGERFSYATRLDFVVHFLRGYGMVVSYE